MPIPKPPQGHATWTDGDLSKITDPGAPKKLLGWEASERPPHDFMNWLLFVLNEWQIYFESVTDEFIAEFDAVVADTGGTHTTLAAALTASVAGWKILVVDPDAAVATTANVALDNIEIVFKPGAHYTSGAASTAISVAGDRCKIRGGRFISFSTEAIEVLGSASFTMIRDNLYAGNTVDVADAGTATSEFGNVTE